LGIPEHEVFFCNLRNKGVWVTYIYKTSPTLPFSITLRIQKKRNYVGNNREFCQALSAAGLSADSNSFYCHQEAGFKQEIVLQLVLSKPIVAFTLCPRLISVYLQLNAYVQFLVCTICAVKERGGSCRGIVCRAVCD
jgi:hypothetical protein